jgi:hypothetical protein
MIFPAPHLDLAPCAARAVSEIPAIFGLFFVAGARRINGL